jgi:hypothetical protein
MIQTETDYAVPVADIRTRAMLNSLASAARGWARSIRSMLLFKTFGISVMMMHGRRMLEQTPVNMARYAGLLLHPDDARRRDRARAQGARQGQGSARSAQGGVGQLQFWAASALQGGGWGIYGDFLSARKTASAAAMPPPWPVPMVQSRRISATRRSARGCALSRGAKTHPGRDVVKLLKQEAPGSSLWYTRLAFERLVADQLQEEIDPGYRKAWRDMNRKAKEKGKSFGGSPARRRREGLQSWQKIAWGGAKHDRTEDAAQPPRDEYVEDGATLVHAINFTFVNDPRSPFADPRRWIPRSCSSTRRTTPSPAASARNRLDHKVNGGVAGATIRIDRNTRAISSPTTRRATISPPRSHEDALDKLTRIAQELARDLLSREDVRDLIGALLVAGAGIELTVDDAGEHDHDQRTLFDAEFIQDAIGAMIVAGAGITIVYDDVLGKIVISVDALDLPRLPQALGRSADGGGGGGGGAGLTGEQVQDIIGAMVVAGAGISVVYDDAAGTLTITNTIGAGYTDEQVRDVMGACLAAGTRISIAVDDAGNTITISSDALAPSYRGLAVVAKAGAFDFDDTHGGKSILYTGGAAAATLRLQRNARSPTVGGR